MRWAESALHMMRVVAARAVVYVLVRGGVWRTGAATAGVSVAHAEDAKGGAAPSKKHYTGPDFTSLDSAVQEGWYEYLAGKGAASAAGCAVHTCPAYIWVCRLRFVCCCACVCPGSRWRLCRCHACVVALVALCVVRDVWHRLRLWLRVIRECATPVAQSTASTTRSRSR